MEQAALEANDVPQLFVSAKSPEAEIEPICKGLIPAVNVTVCKRLVVFVNWLPNATDWGLITATGEAPIPERGTENGAVLVTIASLPDLFPIAVGVKITLMKQRAPPGRLAGQLLAWEKSPLAVMLDIANARLPGLESVTVCAALGVCRTWVG